MSLNSPKLLAAQLFAIIGLHNLPSKAFDLVTERGSKKKPDPSKQKAAEAKRIKRQQRNIKNAQKQIS